MLGTLARVCLLDGVHSSRGCHSYFSGQEGARAQQNSSCLVVEYRLLASWHLNTHLGQSFC